MPNDIQAAIRRMVRVVEADESSIGVLSTGEKLAVALVLDRQDLLRWYGSMLDAVNRLEGDWLRAAIAVQRDGWNDT